MKAAELFSLLSDATRLRAIMLIRAERELCVCELTQALDESQPKVSRHLALMREAGLVQARREGTWMHYRLSRKLPAWAEAIIDQVSMELGALAEFQRDKQRLEQMQHRPAVRACA